jgi:hypothetical protein
LLLTEIGHDAIGKIELTDLYTGGDQYVPVFDATSGGIAKVGDVVGWVVSDISLTSSATGVFLVIGIFCINYIGIQYVV